jgi:FSR family fosmidomycin resistance protein-like MFS transporter
MSPGAQRPAPSAPGRRAGRFVLLLLAIELLDELVGGAVSSAWPLIRSQLSLSYFHIGILLGLPAFFGNVVETFLFLQSDIGRRRGIILGGGICFAASLLLLSASHALWSVLAALMLFHPSSGAFVTLSQSALMDLDHGRHEKNMARWALAGSLGVVLGPLSLAGALSAGLGWRQLFVFFGFTALALVAMARRLPLQPHGTASHGGMKAALLGAWRSMRRRGVLRWLVLLEFSDLMLDVLQGFLALYFVDLARVSPAQAVLGVAVWTGFGLLGDLLLIPLLDRIRGLVYLKYSAWLELALYAGFLLAPWFPAKLALVGLLGFFNSGWYAILKAGLFTSMPGQSGTVQAVNNVAGLAGSLIPMLLGLVAQRLGLQWAMWLLLLGPLALIAGLPRDGKGGPHVP